MAMPTPPSTPGAAPAAPNKGMFAENVKTLMRQGLSQADAIRQAGSMVGGKGPGAGPAAAGAPPLPSSPAAMAAPGGPGMAPKPAPAMGTATQPQKQMMPPAGGAAPTVPPLTPPGAPSAPAPAGGGAPQPFNPQLMQQLMNRMPPSGSGPQPS